jgi:acyl-CoA reductase-like NAD-dependent aldehyde dehydrogenase
MAQVKLRRTIKEQDMEHTTEIKGLPPNAYTELGPGETYEPIIPADKPVAEITTRSVILGVIMASSPWAFPTFCPGKAPSSKT